MCLFMLPEGSYPLLAVVLPCLVVVLAKEHITLQNSHIGPQCSPFVVSTNYLERCRTFCGPVPRCVVLLAVDCMSQS